MKRLTSDNKMLGYELMKAYPNISCFSTTRHGGCSKGNYASFNCNGYCGDEAEDVNRNRELLRSLLPGESVELVIPHQTHSDHVKVVDTIQVNTELEGVDALVTDIPGYCLCVSTADCVPVLLYDTRKKVVLPFMPDGVVRWPGLWRRQFQSWVTNTARKGKISLLASVPVFHWRLLK